MTSIVVREVASNGIRGNLIRTATVAAAVFLIGTRAQGGITTIFLDDFEAQTSGSNPGIPLVGPAWQINEPAAESLAVAVDSANPSNKVLQLGRYRSTATLAFSTADQTLMATNKNMRLEFQYRSVSAGGYVPYFDVSGQGADPGTLAFFYRVMPQPNLGASSLHDIYYLSPTTGLTDTGLNVSSDYLQTLVISADLAGHTSQLTVGADSVTLPLLTCPSMIPGAQFSNYMIGSGGAATYTNIDNVTATTHAPEPATIFLAISGWLLFLAGWAWKLRRRKG